MNIKQELANYQPYNEQEEKDKEVMLQCFNTFDDIFTRENKLAHFSASCWIVNKQHTKILMIYHNIYQSWAWLGGHADGNEDLLEVAIKEAKEESGLKNITVLNEGKIFSIQILPVDAHIKRGKYVASHLHLDCCFLLEADESEEIRIKEDEISGVKWVNMEDVLKITNEKRMKPIYTKLNEKLKKSS